MREPLIAYVEGMASLLPSRPPGGASPARCRSFWPTAGSSTPFFTSLVSALAAMPAVAAELVMIPFHALIHIAVPSVSGQCRADDAAVRSGRGSPGLLATGAGALAYQTGAGLMELVTPTNGALMAVLLAAGVSLQRWLRFAAGGLLLLTLVGIAGILFAR